MRTAALLVLLAAGVALAGEEDLPVIVSVSAPPRLAVGVAGEIRLDFRAPQANVVAVIQTVEDLDGPAIERSTREREFRVVARAFGYETGELAVPLAFGTPGWKRVTLRLVTDAQERSEPSSVDVEALP